MNPTKPQLKAIKKEKLKIGKDNPTWSQTADGYIYATYLEDDYVTLYIFSPSGNRYKEKREFSDNGWEVTGWSEDF
jgi:hypothetical protein